MLIYSFPFLLCPSVPFPHSLCFGVLIQTIPTGYEELFLYIEPNACFENPLRG